MFTRAYIGFFPINDFVADLYLHFVGTGRDFHDLRSIIGRHRFSGLHAIDENDRARRGAGHDDLSWIR